VAMRDTAAAQACADWLFGHQWADGSNAKVEPAQKIPKHWKLEWYGVLLVVGELSFGDLPLSLSELAPSRHYGT
jgi:hypothetical protein